MPTSQRVDGPTPHGGVASVANFMDADGRPVEKNRAVKVEIFELDAAGNSIHRTYANLSPARSGDAR